MFLSSVSLFTLYCKDVYIIQNIRDLSRGNYDKNAFARKINASQPFGGIMQNPTLELIHKHASVRHYKADPVSSTLVETIIAAAQCASTSRNLQAYSVVAVTQAAKRKKLAKLCGNQAHIREAPVFLVWCADLARTERTCELRGYRQVSQYMENFLVAAVDTALAAQNAALAAESLGLGICYIGYIRNIPEEVVKLLELPRLTFPIIGMTVGWPSKEPHLRPRLPLEAVLHWERYNPDQDEALHEYDRRMAETGIYRRRPADVPKRENKPEDDGWLQYAAERLSQAERTDLRRALKRQGFALK
jgi:FMN reductase (NADPH)